MRRAIAAMCVLFILLGAAPAKKQQPPTTISIIINGDVLPLEPPPRFERGHLFVPVRRTIEALGLEFNRQGKEITTQVGARTVRLTIGSRIASIDGSTTLLDAPPLEIRDVLYAPLRFFTDVLGAAASYDRKRNAVNIVAQLIGRSGSGTIVQGKSVERFGTVSGIDVNSDPPTLTLNNNAVVRTIPITRNAEIEMHDVNANVTVPGELGDVRPGDFARVYMDNHGRVSRVEDAYGSRIGVIAATTSDQFVLDDGHVITPARTTVISLNGKPATLANLQVNDRVTIRYNVETSEVREVLVSRDVPQDGGAPSGPSISSVDIDVNRPLRPGDSFTVTLRGTPHGAASFDIGPYVTDQAMAERSSGVYSGSYTIPRGANFADVPVIGHLRVGGSDAPDVGAKTKLSAASTPPGVTDFAPGPGAVVNTSHPAIYATFSSTAVPVNPSSIVLWVNGRDVTSECVRTADFIQYMPTYAYRNGSMRVVVRVADRAGNTTTKSWQFEVKAR